VRGYDIRDLYAKALALLGLGLLAAAGALVDYWPVHSDIPVVASVLALPPTLVVPRVPVAPPLVAVNVSFRAPARVAPATVTDGAAMEATDVASGAFDAPAESTESPVALPPSLAVAPADTAGMPVSTLELSPPTISAPEATVLAPVVQVAQGGDNMFAGAAKKSGRAVAKTGSVIASGFVTGVSSVASAFGRVFRF
jgi:hypothetical protein